MITKAINNCMRMARERGWERTYWAFDVHGTMIFPNYSSVEIPKQFYPHAKEVLQALSLREDVCMILFTCSHSHEMEQYLEYFRNNNIHFKYVNCNPEVASGGYGCFDSKFYFNVLFEDKAGFDPVEDWLKVKELLGVMEVKKEVQL